ncbi:MAG: nucleotidyltransferase family protein [Pseudomonadota bacterium]
MNIPEKNPEALLIDIARGTPWFMNALSAVETLGLDSWCIGAGAVRNLAWDYLHGFKVPSSLPDIDVAYFDAEYPDRHDEAALQEKLSVLMPEIPWEVTNQASVHCWFEQYFGQRVEPFVSLENAVASWPEYATSVGITLARDGSLKVIAPHGLDDLFSMTVRRNPCRVSIETYHQRIVQKRYAQRWPLVQIVHV